jgi:putative DNA primase/helicase
MLTGGDTVRARFLYEEGFEFLPQFKLWLAANHAPKVRDDDTAMWRRILRVPFENVVPKDKRNPALKALLKDPARSGPAILAWAVEGCLRWQESGLSVPQVVETATEQYRLEQDPLRDFLADQCVMRTEAWVSSKRLRVVYDDWCRANGQKHPLGPQAFNERLRSRGCAEKIGREGGEVARGWQGIGLVTHES